MEKVKQITYKKFSKKFGVVDADLVGKGIFTQEDFEELQKLSGYLKGSERVLNIVKNIPAILQNLGSYLKGFKQAVSNQVKDLEKFSEDDAKDLKDRYPINDYVQKASIVASFKPKNILEIGTFHGWGTASIKAASPKATVYTMNPKETATANNPIELQKIGRVCREKGLKIKQIWADSTKYDYSKLPKIDVAYIDGNHTYDFVYKDLENISKIARKAIVLDDYIPNESSPRGGVRAWGPWNESVVKAVDDFLKDNPKLFKEAYWLENTPICVLIVNHK
jgi:predicted O-methyltransferase YrrM